MSRSLHWERGLKLFRGRGFSCCCLSLPSLGAWIETPSRSKADCSRPSRSLHWERGLKPRLSSPVPPSRCRSLHWERGLKHLVEVHAALLIKSLPSLGAWIETMSAAHTAASRSRSLHWERGLKLEQRHQLRRGYIVAPFTGSVD